MPAPRRHGSLASIVVAEDLRDWRQDPKPRKTHGNGRRCEAEGCPTILSIYNPKTRCYLHADPIMVAPKVRGRRGLRHPNRLEKREVCFRPERHRSGTGMSWETGKVCYLDADHEGPHDFH